MTSLAADHHRGRHLTLGKMNPVLQDKSKQWTLQATRERLKVAGQSHLKELLREVNLKSCGAWPKSKIFLCRCCLAIIVPGTVFSAKKEGKG